MGTVHSRSRQDVVTSDALPTAYSTTLCDLRDASRAAIRSRSVVALPLWRFHCYCEKWMCTIECNYTHSTERHHAHQYRDRRYANG
jgi:hypothetical protein